MKIKKDKSQGVVQLDHFWPYQLTVLADRLARRTSRIVRHEGGLNLSQWRVMAAIAEKPGRTSAEVNNVTPMDKGIVSRSIKGLLELKLIRRKSSAADGRVSHLHLTKRGQVLYQSLMPQVAQISVQAETILTASELKKFQQQLRRLLSVLPQQ